MGHKVLVFKISSQKMVLLES